MYSLSPAPYRSVFFIQKMIHAYVVCFVSDNSAFSDLQGHLDQGFRIFNQFSVFIYSQLQLILPDSFLGDISEWDTYLKIDLAQADLPFKAPADFVLNPDYHHLVTSSRLPRPSKIVEQSMAFCKSFCGVLLSHSILKSALIRGLSCFDSAVMLDGPERHYVAAIEDLTSYFVSSSLITPGDKTKCVSQYRSLVAKLRTVNDIPRSNWVLFLGAHYEMQSRPELSKVFRYASLCLPPTVTIPTSFKISVPDLASDHEAFQSIVNSLQLSYVTVPNVSSLYQDPRSVCRIFRLLGRGRELLSDKKFSVWTFSRGNVSKRLALREKMEAAYKKTVLDGEGLPIFLDVSSPSGSAPSSSNSSPLPGPSLGLVSVSVSRCVEAGVNNDKTKKKTKAKKS